MKVGWSGLLVALLYGHLKCHCGIVERRLRSSGGCLTSNGVAVENWQEISMENPCERYQCRDGKLTTQKCRMAHDNMCRQAFPGRGAYPKCCGTAVLCH
ncbi:hypothetical protein MTO96_018026 [Rhipicephalus appendiculatus]